MNYDFQVLLSTYNGERFLSQQIDSILEQRIANINILIRDDGSSDFTKEILTRYSDTHTEIKTLMGENLGFTKSFMELIKESGNYTYYAFADQDDVWMPNKLAVAAEKLNSYSNIPAIYCSNLELVDEKLNHIGFMFDDSFEGFDLPSRLIENYAVGCTIVMNKKARDLLLCSGCPDINFHDYWVYLLCSYLGKVVYDNNSFILYRQHSNNQIGARNKLISHWIARIKTLRASNTHPRERMARELYWLMEEYYKELLNRDIYKVAFYRKNFITRITLLFNRNIHMSTLGKDLFYRLHILRGSL